MASNYHQDTETLQYPVPGSSLSGYCNEFNNKVVYVGNADIPAIIKEVTHQSRIPLVEQPSINNVANQSGKAIDTRVCLIRQKRREKYSSDHGNKFEIIGFAAYRITQVNSPGGNSHSLQGYFHHFTSVDAISSILSDPQGNAGGLQAD